MVLKEKLMTKDCGGCMYHKEIQLNSGKPTDICTYTQPAKLLIRPAKWVYCGQKTHDEKLTAKLHEHARIRSI